MGIYFFCKISLLIIQLYHWVRWWSSYFKFEALFSANKISSTNQFAQFHPKSRYIKIYIFVILQELIILGITPWCLSTLILRANIAWYLFISYTIAVIIKPASRHKPDWIPPKNVLQSLCCCYCCCCPSIKLLYDCCKMCFLGSNPISGSSSLCPRAPNKNVRKVPKTLI